MLSIRKWRVCLSVAQHAGVALPSPRCTPRLVVQVGRHDSADMIRQPVESIMRSTLALGVRNHLTWATPSVSMYWFTLIIVEEFTPVWRRIACSRMRQ